MVLRYLEPVCNIWKCSVDMLLQTLIKGIFEIFIQRLLVRG